jgi:NAD+ kinase
MPNSRSRAKVSPRVIVVAKRTAYARHFDEGQDPRINELLGRGDPSVRRWQKAHEDHTRTVERVQEILERRGVQSWVLYGPQSEFDATGAELVITVGGDGTLLAASHHVLSTPILGVNSAPAHSVGFFCGGRFGNISRLIDEALSGKMKPIELGRMAVDVDGQKVSSRVLNEALFCHASPAATSRYILKALRRSEEHRSSGVWVGTAAGSTGALRSAGGRIMPLLSRKLQVVVREPYQGERKPYALQQFVLEDSVKIQSKMQDAYLFLDGPYRRVRVEIGETLTFAPSDQPLRVLGLAADRKKLR